MTRLLRRAFCFCSLLLAASYALAQADFSADVFNDNKPDAPQAKIYATKDKMRFEPAQKDPRGSGAVIVNLATHTSTV